MKSPNKCMKNDWVAPTKKFKLLDICFTDLYLVIYEAIRCIRTCAVLQQMFKKTKMQNGVFCFN